MTRMNRAIALVVGIVLIGALLVTTAYASRKFFVPASVPVTVEQPPVKAAEALKAPDAEMQRLRLVIARIQIARGVIENAQLRAQAAKTDIDQASVEAERLIAALQKPGLDLDINTGVYTPKKPAK